LQKEARNLKRKNLNNSDLNIVIPIHEILFYGIVLFWAILRYHVLKKPEDIPEETYIIPGFTHYNSLLEEKNPYYKELSETGRKKFVSRLRLIRDEIEFQSREDFNVTEEVRVLISACITQLTFGFEKPILPNLKGVVIFPSIFYSRLSEAWVKGLAMGNGVVFLSWEDFESGYRTDTATYNLGLHEFAHMLRMQAIGDINFDYRLHSYFDEWEENGEEAFENINRGEQNFFREYGGTNKAEFFSVCIENFFEVPESFSKELPEVYWHLCYLMKQNPLNPKEDFSFNQEDTEIANELVKEPLPEYQIHVTDLEQKLWYYLAGLKNIPIYIALGILINGWHTENIIRMGLVILITEITLRIQADGGLKSIKYTEYQIHVLKRSLPLGILISALFERVFS
jgi:hypothetical protein